MFHMSEKVNNLPRIEALSTLSAPHSEEDVEEGF